MSITKSKKAITLLAAIVMTMVAFGLLSTSDVNAARKSGSAWRSQATTLSFENSITVWDETSAKNVWYKFKTENASGIDYSLFAENREFEERPYDDYFNISLIKNDEDSSTACKFLWLSDSAWVLKNDSLKKNTTYFIHLKRRDYVPDDSNMHYYFQLKKHVKAPTKGKISKVTSGKKYLKVAYHEASYAAKYQVRVKKQGNKSWKTYTTTSRTKTIKGLTSKKKYSVQVRAIRVYKGKTYNGSWSSTKTVTVK